MELANKYVEMDTCSTLLGEPVMMAILKMETGALRSVKLKLDSDALTVANRLLQFVCMGES